MRDGVVLGADVYVPRGAGPVPAIAIRHPYGRRTPEMGMAELGSFFARKGYACVVQDVRGKFSSGGTFDPAVGEIEDGYDTVDWIANAAWCNGRIGLWGESYYGFTAIAAAISGHPAVAGIAPGDIGTDWRGVWYRGGALQLNTAGYWAIAMDDPEYADLTRVDPWHLPLVGMAEAAGGSGAYFRATIERAGDEGWWRERSLRHLLADVRVPMLTWSGWYDNFTGEQLVDLALIRSTHPAPETVHLMVGPWDHEGSGEHTDHAVCVRVPPTAAHRWDAYQAFFDRYVMQAADAAAVPPAEVFTLNAGWQRLESWPPAAMTPTPYHLRADGVLSVEPPATDEEPDRYDYDPANPIPETLGGNCWELCEALGDRREIERRPDVLTYATPPLADDLELTGPITAVLYAASSAVDTDFTVAVIDVFEDGTANQIQDGIVRARFRDGMDAPSPIEPDEIVRYEIDLFATSYVLRRGHRLQVDVSSSCFDRYDRNPNTGDAYGEATAPVVAEQAVHHAPARASHVVLPVIAGTR
jgi:putative CocE/NonD family hydrolase